MKRWIALVLLAGCSSPPQPTRLAELDIQSTGPVVFRQDSGLLAVSGPKGRIGIYDATGKAQPGPPEGSGLVEVMALSAGGKLAYAHALQPTLEVWDLRSRFSAGRITLGELGQEARKIHHNAVLWSDGRSAMVSKGAYAYVGGKQGGHLNFLAYGPGSRLYANDERGQLFWLQDAPPKVLGSLPPAPGGYRCAALSSDGKRVAVSTMTDEVLIFEMAEHKQVSRAPSIPGVKHMSFSPDGATLAVCASRVHLLETNSGESLAEWPIVSTQVVFRPDGQWLAAAGNDSRVWDTKTLQELPQTGGFRDLDFLGNSGKIWGVGYDKVLLKDLTNQKIVSEIPGYFLQMTLSPDEKLATLAPRIGKLQLWKLP